MVLRSFRLIRILKFEHYMEAFTMFDNVLAQSRGVIVTTSLSAAIVWVVCATLFWMFEGDNPLSDGISPSSCAAEGSHPVLFLLRRGKHSHVHEIIICGRCRLNPSSSSIYDNSRAW